MDQKRRLFIYDRKEVGVLILLGVGVALFAFTLGVHLGKQVVPMAVETAGEVKAVDPLTVAQEQSPSRTEISQEVKHVPGAVDETLDQSLRDEIAKTGLQVEKPRQVELPEALRKKETSSPEVGAVAHGDGEEAKEAAHQTPKQAPVKVTKVIQPRNMITSRYTLQVGSYPSLRDAEPELLKLNENGLRAEVREVEITGKGKWYRLFVGQFDTVKDADKAGKNFRKERRIADFVVVRSPEASATQTE